MMRKGMQDAETARLAEAGRATAAAVIANGQIRELADARSEDRGRMAELRDQISVKRAAGPAASLIDTKGIGKPKNFTSKASEWPDYT